MQDFTTLNLPEALLSALDKMNFNTPTPIQAQSIPQALEGKDILGSAQTGTGKTGAFGVPLVAHLLNNPRGTALVMTPTRELAVQVMAALKQMLSMSPQIKTAVLIGGEPMPKQFNQLKMRPRLIVGTPGRINDHLARGTVQLNEANFLVLDETDRMLDMGFGVQIDKILKYMPKQRQTLMFSATLPPYIIKMSNQYMNEPVRVSAGNVSTPVIKIEQEMIKINNSDKYEKLTEELAKRSGSVIVFVKSKHGADKLAYRLSKDEHEADAIHGDLRQNKRDKVIKSFREGKYRILVATDIAARGLDIPHIEHVINFDLPQAADDYIHRIGRTGRNGAEGKALNFVSGEDGAKWKAIQRLLNPGDKGQYEGDGQPQQRGSSGGGRSKPAYGAGNNRGSSNGSPYAKKRPFGSRADGSDRGNRYDAPRQDRGDFRDRPARSDAPRGEFRSDRPQSDRSDRPARPDGQRFDNHFESRGERGERSGNKFAAPRPDSRQDSRSAPRQDRDGNREGANRSRFEEPRSEGGYKNRNKDFGDFRADRSAPRSDAPRQAPRQDRDGNREGGNRSRFEAPRSEGRSNAPRFEGRRAEGGRSDGARSNNGGNRPSGNAQGNRSNTTQGSGEKPRYSSRTRAA